jgi:hypothetical protein
MRTGLGLAQQCLVMQLTDSYSEQVLLSLLGMAGKLPSGTILG